MFIYLKGAKVLDNIGLRGIRVQVHIGIDNKPVRESKILTRGCFWELR